MKQLDPILVTELGIVIVVIFVKYNARLPIALSEESDSNSILFNAELPKQLFPILITEFGIVIVFKDDVLNALSLMSVRLEFSSNVRLDNLFV